MDAPRWSWRQRARLSGFRSVADSRLGGEVGEVFCTKAGWKDRHRLLLRRSTIERTRHPGHNLEPRQQMTNSDFISYLKTVDTPTLSNAIEDLERRPRSEGFAPLAIHSLFPDLGRMCGYAVTAQVETVTCMSPLSAEPFFDLFAALEAAPKPAVVVLQEIGGQRDLAAHCGEVMASIFTRLGAVGLVSD